jgi:hypothetical protein
MVLHKNAEWLIDEKQRRTRNARNLWKDDALVKIAGEVKRKGK